LPTLLSKSIFDFLALRKARSDPAGPSAPSEAGTNSSLVASTLRFLTSKPESISPYKERKSLA